MGRVLTSPSATPVQLADAYRHLATIDAAAGHTDAALQRTPHAALALDPTAAPPAAASPTVVTLFNRVRAARHSASAWASRSRCRGRCKQTPWGACG